MSELKLGISEEDRERIKDTEVIFHSAASVRFNDPLRFIINVNVRGTRELLLLAQEMPNLKVRSSVYTHIPIIFKHLLKGFHLFRHWLYLRHVTSQYILF